MTDLLPDGGLRLNPDVSRPPFRWLVSLPHDPSWSVLDTSPATWQRAAERLVDDRLAGRRLKSAQRREILTFFADIVAQCQQGGTLISLVQLGQLTSGQYATAGLHIAWYDSTPDLASLATVRQAISRQGIVEEHDTPAGPLLLQRDHLSVYPTAQDTRVGLASLQAFLPVPGQSWTAVVASATPHSEMTEILHDLVLEVASSIQVDGAEPGAAPSVDTPPAVDRGEYEPVAQPQAPGIERGFGTLRAHRVDGDETGADGASEP